MQVLYCPHKYLIWLHIDLAEHMFRITSGKIEAHPILTAVILLVWLLGYFTHEKLLPWQFWADSLSAPFPGPSHPHNLWITTCRSHLEVLVSSPRELKSAYIMSPAVCSSGVCLGSVVACNCSNYIFVSCSSVLKWNFVTVLIRQAIFYEMSQDIFPCGFKSAMV